MYVYNCMYKCGIYIEMYRIVSIECFLFCCCCCVTNCTSGTTDDFKIWPFNWFLFCGGKIATNIQQPTLTSLSSSTDMVPPSRQTVRTPKFNVSYPPLHWLLSSSLSLLLAGMTLTGRTRSFDHKMLSLPFPLAIRGGKTKSIAHNYASTG